MDYIQQLQFNLKNQSQEGNIRGLIDDEFFRLADKITELNISQIDAHEGFDDKPLENTNPVYDGVYSKATSAYASMDQANTPKPTGSPYNFNWTGNFLGNFHIKAVAKGFVPYSTGTGGGDKQRFFEGYRNMFGLNTENTSIIETEVLYFVLEKILSKVYE